MKLIDYISIARADWDKSLENIESISPNCQLLQQYRMDSLEFQNEALYVYAESGDISYMYISLAFILPLGK